MVGNWWSELPLAVNLIGPMVFRQRDNVMDVWMPEVDTSKYPHQAGIETHRSSFIFKSGISEYFFNDPNPKQYYGGILTYNPVPSVPCMVEAPPPTSFHVHLVLPRPKWIIGLTPISCKIKNGSSYDKNSHPRPVGFRFLYEKAGTPEVTWGSGGSKTLDFDPAPEEKQMEIWIKYSPFNLNDPNHFEAKDDFQHIGAMLKVDLDVDIDPSPLDSGPVNDCKAPVVMLM